jgi:hypothetical protein
VRATAPGLLGGLPAGLLGGLLAGAVVLAGCTAGQPAGDAWAGRGKPVVFPGEPAPSPPPGGIVTGVPGLRVALEDRVIAAAGLIRPVTSRCDTTDIEPAFTCRVTYLGETVTYRVSTTAQSADSYTWRARPDALVATRAGIEAAIWRRYAARASAISCDTPFPARQRVAPRTILRQRCYFKPVFADAAFGRDSDNAARTVAVQITIGDGSIGLEEITQ